MWITVQEMGWSWTIIQFQTQYCPISGGKWEQRLKCLLSIGHLIHISVSIFSCTGLKPSTLTLRHAARFLSTQSVIMHLFLSLPQYTTVNWHLSGLQMLHCGFVSVLGYMHRRLSWVFRFCRFTAKSQVLNKQPECSFVSNWTYKPTSLCKHKHINTSEC